MCISISANRSGIAWSQRPLDKEAVDSELNLRNCCCVCYVLVACPVNCCVLTVYSYSSTGSRLSLVWWRKAVDRKLMVQDSCLPVKSFWLAMRTGYAVTILRMLHLRLLKVFCNSQIEHALKMRLASIDFSHRGAQGFRSSWL